MLEYLKDRGRDSGKGMKWVGIATGAMLENGLSEGMLGFDLMWKSATIYGTGEGMWAASTLGWIGRTVVGVVEDLESEGGSGDYIYSLEFVTSQNEILAGLKDLDGKRFDVIKADVEECVREGERRMEKGFFDGAMMLLERNVLFGEIGDTDVWKTEMDRARNDSSLREAVRRIVEKLKRDGRSDCWCG